MSKNAHVRQAAPHEQSLAPKAIDVYLTPTTYGGRLNPSHEILPGMILTRYAGVYPGGTEVEGRIATFTEADAESIITGWNVQGYRYWIIDAQRIPVATPPALSAKLTPKRVCVYWEAFSTNELADQPEWAEIEDGAALVARVRDLQALANAHNLTHVGARFRPDAWAPEDTDQALNPNGEELVVSRDGHFFLRCYPKHGSFIVETRGMRIEDVEAAIGSAQDPEIFLTGDGRPEWLRERIAEVLLERHAIA